jgi:hypothetical protein
MSAHMADDNPAMVTDDEIQAAIAEIENMSPAEVAAIPGLSDGSGDDARGSPERPSPSGPDPSNASATDTPAEHAVAPQRSDRPEGAASGHVDSGDEGSDAEPAGGIAQRIDTWVRWFRSGLSRALARLRTSLGRKSPDTLPEETPQQPATTEEEQSDSTADVLPAEGICRLVDQALDKLNGPFVRFSSQVRSAIGSAAIVTVVISIAALLVFPRVMPHRDAPSVLREKRAQLDARRTAPAPTESPTAGNDSPGP